MKIQLILLVSLFLVSLSAQAQEPKTLMFCRPNNAVSALAYIAEQQGYFRDEGLNVIFLTTTNGKICQDDLIAGKADVAAYAEVPLNYIAFTGTTLKIIAQTGINPETALVARQDKGIRDEKDIKGKSIAYLPGTVSYIYLAHLLEKTGLSLRDIHAVPLQPPAMPEALQGGMIDGFVMWQPWGDEAIKNLGSNAIRLYDPKLYNYASIIAITQKFADRPRDVEALLRALLKSESYLHTHTKEAITFLANVIKFDQGALERDWPHYEYKIKLDNSLITLMENNAHYIVRDDPNFKDKAIPNFKTIIDPTFLRAVAPERLEQGLFK